MPDCPFLADCAAGYRAAGERFEALVADLDERQAGWRPGPERWSVAECLDHLSIAARQYFPKMEKAIRRGRERGVLGSAPFERRSFVGRMILGVLEPSSGRKVPAPKIFRPRPGILDFERVCDDYRAAVARLGELAEEADGLDLDRLRLATPIAPFPRLTLAEAFKVHALHFPRHLAQAEAVTEAAGFPS